MQFQNNFDLEEFLGYLLPGFLLFFVLLDWIVHGSGVAQGILKVQPEAAGIFISITFLITASLIFGHISSLVARFVLRPIVNAMLGDPEIVIGAAASNANGFFSTPIVDALQTKFVTKFGLNATDPSVSRAAPRMIRAYVQELCPQTTAIRKQLVRHRAICANSILPLCIIAMLQPFSLGLSGSALCLVCSLLLIWKQRDLDMRETKEVYMAFLVCDP